LHQCANLPAGAGVFGHVRRDDKGFGAQGKRLGHRHRRAHPEGSRDVTACRYDRPGPAAADNDRLVAKVRIVTLFNRGVERVAIDMRDLEAGGSLKIDGSRRTATRTARRAKGMPVQAVAAKHMGNPIGHDPSE
jgi:hypothetical protein